jgi:hypothetical protein
LPALRGTFGRFQSRGSAARTTVFRLQEQHRDQRPRKKTEAIFEVFVIMAPAMYQKLQGGQRCPCTRPALRSGGQ